MLNELTIRTQPFDKFRSEIDQTIREHSAAITEWINERPQRRTTYKEFEKRRFDLPTIVLTLLVLEGVVKGLSARALEPLRQLRTSRDPFPSQDESPLAILEPKSWEAREFPQL